MRKYHKDFNQGSLYKWLGEKQYNHRPKSPMSQSMAFARKRWAGLSAYLLHGQMEIDKNLIENAGYLLELRRIVYLFARSHQAPDNDSSHVFIHGQLPKEENQGL